MEAISIRNEVTFEAPGPGHWELDNSHFSRPFTLYSKKLFTDSLVRGLKEGMERYGLALSHLAYSMVNGFFYQKTVLCGLEENHQGALPEGLFERPEIVERFANGQKAFETKLWLQDLKRWDDEVKPDSIKRNLALQAVKIENLTREQLLDHLVACRKNALEMMYRHHIFTVPAVLPIGLYVSNAMQWTGLPSSELLYLLKGSTPVSVGTAKNEIDTLVENLKREGVKPESFSHESPEQTLKSLRISCDSATVKALDEYLEIVGYRLITGYDITDKYGFDMPEVLVNNIWTAFNTFSEDDEQLLKLKEAEIRSKVPTEFQEQFDELLADAKAVNRLRDERGIYNDVLASGLARRAILEAGRRLENCGILSDRNLFLYASHEEMLSMVSGDKVLSQQTLQERAQWCKNHTVDDAPEFLGDAEKPAPQLSMFPEASHQGLIALFTVIGEIYDDVSQEESKPEEIKGMSVSPGVYEGTARVVRSLDDFGRLVKGDILVTKNTTAAFNTILPLLGAIVTDRGGQLSHAAIVSREYGIPAVVSTKKATQVIKDGARIRVDGKQGVVEVLS